MTADVHTHVIPKPLLARAHTRDGLFGVREVDGFMVHPGGFRAPLTPAFHDPDVILARMDQTGVRVSVLSTSPMMFFYGEEAQAAAEYARAANEGLRDLISHDDRLHGLAHLPLQAPDLAARELEYAVRELGLRGAQIGTNVGSLALTDAHLDPVFKMAQGLDVPLLLHPYFDGPKPGLEDYFLTNTIGNPMETAIAATKLIHAGVLDRWDKLKFILVHGGGHLLYQLGRLDHAYKVVPENRKNIAAPPSAYLQRFWFDTLTHDDLALQFLMGRVGPERLLLGTDLPYNMADTEPMARIRRVRQNLPDILRENARALFSI
ncbi:amidohydrolase family protein [Streptomyces sp. NPDC004647]|uniref:amidohydrolase family protein n=1 Tax=Streptomyces sp. NPDC004647 TaxID=3154671 RepID=UPI0033BF3359